jgi:signal transduction histidine kinase
MEREAVSRIAHPPVGLGLLGLIMSERKPLRLEHMSHHAKAYGFPENHPHMDSLLGVPIVLGDRLYGMLYMTDRLDGAPFTEQDEWLIETMAGYAAIAIASSRLRQQESRIALLEERERISMELHDGVIQSLYALGMQLELIRTSPKPATPQDWRRIVTGLNGVIDDIRSYILNLKSRSYGKKSMRECLEDVIARLHLPQQLQVRIDAPDAPIPFSPATYEAVCQMAHEAVSNVVRHAEATELHLSAQQANSHFEMTISDNGKGFDPNSNPREEGLGLRNIQQRARLRGGHVEIDSTPGAGTSIMIQLPIHV